MDRYAIDDLKQIYRVLHEQLLSHPDLLDSDFFSDLQHHLQRQASADGVDVSDHGAWDAWLGNAVVACALRVEKRRTL